MSTCNFGKDKFTHNTVRIMDLWSFESGDYVFDPAYEEVRVWFGYPSKEYDEIIWLPRQDQLQEICINFYMQNLRISRHEAFFHFLGWYASCLKETYDIGRNIGKNGEYEEINSSEELRDFLISSGTIKIYY